MEAVWWRYQTDFFNLADNIQHYISTQSDDYCLQHADTLRLPSTSSRLLEIEEFERLQRQLPLTFISPSVEHRAYDYIVDGNKWQLKVATYIQKSDSFRITLKRSGRSAGKNTYRQYSHGSVVEYAE